MKIIYSIVLVCVFVSCKDRSQEKPQDKKFSIPTILLPDLKTDSIKKHQLNFLTEIWPPFISKFKFADTILIKEKRDTSTLRDFVGEIYDVKKNGPIGNDGFQIITNYNKPVLYKEYVTNIASYFYPVFVVNETKSTKMFTGKDSYVFAIQEAKDSTGSWYPIESKGFDFCGNGYWGLKIHPNEFAVFLLPVYDGEFNTELRVRLKIGTSVYVSQPFMGNINYNQFYTHPKWPSSEMPKGPQAATIFHRFYGAIPKEFWD